MRIGRVIAVSVAVSAIFTAGVAYGYWRGSPVNLVMQPTVACEPSI